jgi:hypothetical protein
MSRVLVVGAPRSGTTWVARVLCAAAGATYVEEPDNHFRFGFAFRAKRALARGAYPQVDAGADLGDEEFDSLWGHAFAPAEIGSLRMLARGSANRLVTLARPPRVAEALAGSPPDGRLRLAERLAVPQQADDGSRSVLVKSVYAPLCAEWVSSRHAARTVVVLRRPLDVVASWVALGWLGSGWPDPLTSVPLPLVEELGTRFAAQPPPGSRLGRAAWLIGVLQCALAESASRNPGWSRVEHEDLYTAPLERFPPLAAAVGLEWSEAGDRLIEEGSRPGTGYETRRAPAQLRNAWRTRLSDSDVRELESVFDRMPLSS